MVKVRHQSAVGILLMDFKIGGEEQKRPIILNESMIDTFVCRDNESAFHRLGK